MQSNVLFALDRLVHGVVRAITGIIRSIGSILPIPGMNNLMGFVRAFLRLAVGLVDEVILAYIIRNKSDNPDRKSTRLNSSHVAISYAVFCLKKKTKHNTHRLAD